MHWKRTLAIVLAVGLAALLVSFMVSHWISGEWHIGSRFLIMNAALAIALTLGFVGIYNLDRGGHQKVKRNLTVCLLVLLLVANIPDFPPDRLHRSVAGWDAADLYYFIPFVALLVAIFPLSLYLNWKQKESTSRAFERQFILMQQQARSKPAGQLRARKEP